MEWWWVRPSVPTENPLHVSVIKMRVKHGEVLKVHFIGFTVNVFNRINWTGEGGLVRGGFTLGQSSGSGSFINRI